MRQALILAGGLGTRLQERLAGLPKPLADVGGTPLLGHQLELLARHGFAEAVVLVNHAADRIRDYLSSWSNPGLRVECVDDGQPKGTAGAVLASWDRLGEEFLVMYGDTLLEVDLARFHRFHAAEPAAAATLFVHPNDHPRDSDLVELDDAARVLAFHPCPHQPSRYHANLVNAALYWVRRAALAPWRDRRPPLDFGKDLFPAMLRQGAVLRGYESPEYIKDAGTPDRLDRVRHDFACGRVARSSLACAQAAVLLDRDGTLNVEVDHLRHPDQLALLPGVAQSVRRLNLAEYRCCIVTNQPVVARGECAAAELRQIHNKLECLLGEAGAFVDRIYHCPHHPDAGFPGERAELKLECDCRKPKTGLVERAVREFNIDRARSWFVGDGSVDMETARRAGLKSILVETGYAGLDYRYWAVPDFVVPGMPEAVNLIVEDYPRWLGYCGEFAAQIGEGDVVLIGGQSRSGKSSFSSALRDALRAQGRTVLRLAADRWLQSVARRRPGVLGRFDLASLQSLAQSLGDRARRPTQLVLPGYHKLRRERFEGVETVSLAPGDVVLVEGVVALALHVPGQVAVHRFHVELDEQERARRVLREYLRRGCTAAQAEEIYRARRAEEYPVIEGLAGGARKVALAAA